MDNNSASNKQKTFIKIILPSFLLFFACVFIWGHVHNPDKAKRTGQASDAAAFVKEAIGELEAEGRIVGAETKAGQCAYSKVITKQSEIDNTKWNKSATQMWLTTAYTECEEEQVKKEEQASTSTKQITAHLACQRYAKNYFFPYEVKFHNIAGVIYDAARGNDEWVYTLDITIKSAQGGEVRYNMDCVAGNFSNDNSSAEVVMFEALPYL